MNEKQTNIRKKERNEEKNEILKRRLLHLFQIAQVVMHQNKNGINKHECEKQT